MHVQGTEVFRVLKSSLRGKAKAVFGPKQSHISYESDISKNISPVAHPGIRAWGKISPQFVHPGTAYDFWVRINPNYIWMYDSIWIECRLSGQNRLINEGTGVIQRFKFKSRNFGIFCFLPPYFRHFWTFEESKMKFSLRRIEWNLSRQNRSTILEILRGAESAPPRTDFSFGKVGQE